MSTRAHHERPTQIVRRAERAFTLIELLVVMIIIAILMAIAIPTFLAQKSQAKKTQLLETMHHIQSAIEACATNNTDGTYNNCTEQSQIAAFEPSLAPVFNLGYQNTSRPFDINGVWGDNDEDVVPVAGRTYDGYTIQVWMKDGDRFVWFQLVHRSDGKVIKRCGEGWGMVNPPGADDDSPGTTVPGSRVCTTGTW